MNRIATGAAIVFAGLATWYFSALYAMDQFHETRCGNSGCPEANVVLSAESRPPKWFATAEGIERGAVILTMDTYLSPSERFVFTLLGKDGNVLSVVTTLRLGGYLYPRELRNPPPGFSDGYPKYEVLISEGFVDIVEHRRMEPIFYTTDEHHV